MIWSPCDETCAKERPLVQIYLGTNRLRLRFGTCALNGRGTARADMEYPWSCHCRSSPRSLGERWACARSKRLRSFRITRQKAMPSVRRHVWIVSPESLARDDAAAKVLLNNRERTLRLSWHGLGAPTVATKEKPAEAGASRFSGVGGRRLIAGGRIDRIGIYVWPM